MWMIGCKLSVSCSGNTSEPSRWRKRQWLSSRSAPRTAATGWTCNMSTQSCPDCYTAGDGNCQMCHGEGKIHSERRYGQSVAEMSCPKCKGSGACPTCGGTGVLEAGGEG